MNLSSEIKKRVSCVDACKQYGIDLNRHGFARCPFHPEKTASFRAWPGDRGFFCFGCGAHGSTIDLVMKLFDVSLYEACKRLNDDFRLGLIKEGNVSRNERITQNKEAWERRKRQDSIDEEHRALIDEFNQAILYLRWCEIGFYAAEPTDPDDEWSELFVLAARERERARARADEALETLQEFEKTKFAS